MLTSGLKPVTAQEFTPLLDPEKSDSLVLRNGDIITGDFKQLQRGIVTFDTDAASKIYLKWPRVVTATTGKTFEIIMADGSTYVGSLRSGDTAYRVQIELPDTSVEVAIDSIVEMVRIKNTIWNRLDGSVDAGFDYTQQQSKVDLNLSATVNYDVAHNRLGLGFSGTFSRQDSAADIRRGNLAGIYARDLSDSWFWAAGAGGQTNSQMSLEYAWSVGTGPGRFLARSNRMAFTMWLGLNVRTERYADQSSRITLPLSLTTDFQWFVWSGMSTDLSSKLVISPILNDAGRWQISWTASLNRELVNSLYLNIGVTEIFDSQPPTDATKNDLSFTSSLGWSV